MCVCVCVCVPACVFVCACVGRRFMRAYVGVWVDGCVRGRVCAWMSMCMDGWVRGWVCAWMGGCVDRWVFVGVYMRALVMVGDECCRIIPTQ